jgi:hypothetical protein
MSFPHFKFAIAAATTTLAVMACDNPLALPAPLDGNFVDTLTLYALQGTPIAAPSGYSVSLRVPTRTDRGNEPFDFAFDIDADNIPLIFTTGALGLARTSAAQMSDRQFEDIEIAPTDNYEQDSSLTVGVDSIFVVRSAPVTFGCAFFLGALPRYGKFLVLAIDPVERAITLQALVNINCGYRSLEPGLPTR